MRTVQGVLAGILALTVTAAAQADDMPGDVSASGNEPFWRVDVTGDTLVLSRPDFDEIILSVIERRPADAGHVIVAASSSPALRAVLTLGEGPCSDTMADQTYPYTAEVELGDTVLTGCGGDPRDLLTAAESWTVTDLGGAAPVADTEITMTFSDAGAVSGSGGCNRFTSIYRITGEGMSFGPIGATRMACPGPAMDQEMRFFAALEQVRAFDIAEDGSLVLIGPEGPVLTASAP
jgi:heat shock protein HslJ